MTKQNIKYAFKTFDINGDGLIDLNEFRSVLPKNQKRDSEDLEDNSTQMETLEESLVNQDKIWIEILDEVDINNDGQISFEEFSSCLEKYIQVTYKKL